MSLLRGLSPTGRFVVMSGGLLALLGAEGALLAYLSSLPNPPLAGPPTPTPAPVTTPAASHSPLAAAPPEALYTAPGAMTPADGSSATATPASSPATNTTPNSAPHPYPFPPGSSPAPNVGPRAGHPQPFPVSPAPVPAMPNVHSPAPGAPSAPGAPGNPAALDPKRAQAMALFDRAGAAAQKGDAKTALALWQQVEALAPNNLPTQQNLALVFAQTGQLEKALVHARRAVKLAPTNPSASFGLARVLLAQNKPREALAPLRETVRLAPNERDGHAMLARALLSAGQPQAAYDQWALLANKDPKDLEAHLLAASLASEKLNRPSDAMRLLERAQQAHPNEPNVAMARARLAIAAHQPKQAAAILTGAVKAAPDAFDLYPALADARAAAGDNAGAAQAAQGALARLPKAANDAQKTALNEAEGRLRLSLGRFYGQQKQLDQAREQFDRAARLLPRDPQPRVLAAMVELQRKNSASAVRSLQAALALDPKDAPSQLLLAQTLAGSGRAREAEVAFARYAELRPHDERALAQWAQLEAGSGASQTRALERLALSRPTDGALWQQLASVQLRAKRPKDALASLQKAAALTPDDALLLERIAVVQGDLEQHSGQFNTLRRLLSAHPDRTQDYVLCLRAGEAAGQSEAARTFVARQLAAHPDNAAALTQTLDFLKDRPDQAKALLSDVVSRNPNASAAKTALASLGATGAPTKAPS